MAETITLRLENFRAIKEADIKLNGITVVTGINGSGKSTLSKFLYYTFRLANSYEDLHSHELSRRLEEVYLFLETLKIEINNLGGNIASYRFNGLKGAVEKTKNKEIVLTSLRRIYPEYQEVLNYDANKAKKSQERIISILCRILKIDNDEKDISILMKMLEEQIAHIFNSVQNILNDRPVSLLQEELSEYFPGSRLPEVFTISEYGNQIVGNDSNSVSIIHSVQKVAYIDTPMMLGIETTQPYWDDLNNILKKKSGRTNISSISQIIKSEILQGESYFEEDTLFDNQFTFAHINGSIYNLLECATGIKAFSILQLMLKNGFLTPNTLLIIDEPEVHLHPQWIVEYARLIVLLNKHIGVHFFIASHNPDMVSAIKYISEKEQTTSSLNYYLAEQVELQSPYYIYKDLGTDINSIFKSFNIALDRINQYGVAEEDNDIF